eukprot:TRINITY_DN766_c0_g1_i4.p1 TRINITY_DN766_c0_g1~~TRINITY_DN766_c0_g1_i4.p1  ORF type:complete len:203 (-),score=91.98 TRINITY_DN766_c0_g1_i4:335-943(-)
MNPGNYNAYAQQYHMHQQQVGLPMVNGMMALPLQQQQQPQQQQQQQLQQQQQQLQQQHQQQQQQHLGGEEEPKPKRGRGRPRGSTGAAKKIAKKSAGAGAGRGKGKKKKDPNKPVRAKTPYLVFVQENRAKYKLENPGLQFGDLSRLVGQKWKELGEEDKKPYIDSAQRDKHRFDEEMKNYTPATAADDDGGDEEDEDDDED